MDYSNEIRLRGSIFRSTRGQAILTLQEGQSIRCVFELVQYHKGSILAFCTVDLEDVSTALERGLTSLSDDTVTFEAETEDGFRVELSDPMVVNSSINSRTGQPVEVGFVFIASQAHFKLIEEAPLASFFRIKFPLVNLELPPAAPIEYSDPAGNTYSRSIIKVLVEENSLYFESTPDSSALLRELEYTKGIAVTATVFTFLGKQEELATVNSNLSDLNVVLTFMQGTRINNLGCDVLTPEHVVIESWWYDAVTRPYSNSTLLNRLLAENVKLRFGANLWAQSVQTMFAKFRAKNATWNLSELVSAFIDAEAGDYLELRGLKICGCVEILRARFLALHSQTYLIPIEDFDAIFPQLQKKITEALQELLPDAPQETLQSMSGHLHGLNYSPFRRALRQFCKEMSYQVTRATNRETKQETEASLSAFIAIRNALVHYGHFAVPDEPTESWPEERISTAMWQQYQFIERLTAGMLAALLGWMQIKPETQMPEAPDFWE